MLDVLVRTETTVESMARASRARASATMGTPEECAKLWTTFVKRLIVDNMATVLKGVVSAQNHTRGPSAIKPPNHVVQQEVSGKPRGQHNASKLVGNGNAHASNNV